MHSAASELAPGPGDPLGGAVAGDPEVAARSPLQLFWRRFRRDRVATVALAFIALLVVVAVAAPLIVSIAGTPGPNAQDASALDSFTGTPTGPSRAHPLGVDPNGEDVFARVLYGARVSLEVAILATLLSVAIGVAIGLLAGFYRGWVDGVLSRLVDVMLAFPILLLALGIASACSLGNGCLGGAIKPGLGVVILVIVVVNWTTIARIVRGQVLSLREQEFVEAARSLGASDRRIVVRDILPNLAAPIIVYGTLLVPQNILLEAALSFLGVGVQPPTASWGAMISDAITAFPSAWWYILFPGLALLCTVLAFNLLGDGLQDALDPRAAA
ncbi:MAG TPA: ABC transporter permease [Solirubrobacteraceae bacterium]|nr:ABC transporter permease [Solirubrobacteraceae bacterium]